MPSGEEFEFILEKEKLEKVKKVVAHSGGEVLSQVCEGDAVRVKVRKAAPAD